MVRDEQKITELKRISQQIRLETLKSVFHAGSGHLGGSLSAAEILACLYFDVMSLRPDDPGWADRDRFVLSKGHAAPGLYAALALRGFFSVEELRTLRQYKGRLLGHPTCAKTPGVDMTSGSLGQGLSVGLGMRLAARLLGQDFYVYVMLGDGELQEGQNWEAAMAGAHFKVNKLIAIVDYNRVQLDGTMDEIMEVAPLQEKWVSFGWQTIEADGHDVSSVLTAFDKAKALSDVGPVVIICRTIKGKGVSYMEHQAVWHGAVPDDEQFSKAKSEIIQRFGGESYES